MRFCSMVFVMTGALLTHLAVAPVAAGAREGVKATTSWTFEKVWYRTEKRGTLIKAFNASGTLTVNATALEFRAKKLELHIPMAAIHAVSIGKMKRDMANQWSVVEYEKDGVTHRVGFKDGKQLGSGRDTVAIYDAIRGGLLVARGEGKVERSPVSIALEQYPERMTWKGFQKEIRRGFPDPPKTLVTDPARLGLLLIDAYITQYRRSYAANGIVLVRKGDKAYVFRGSPFTWSGFSGFSDPARGIVLFTGLEPGEYVVKIVRGWNTNGTLYVEMPPHPDLALRIEAGKVHYLGRLRIKRKRKTQDVERQHDPAREAKVLNLFADEYADTPWATLARERARAARR